MFNPIPENGIGNHWVTALILKKKDQVIDVKYICSQAKTIFLFYTTGLALCIFIKRMEVTDWFSAIIETE